MKHHLILLGLAGFAMIMPLRGETFSSLTVTNNANIGGSLNASQLRGPLNTQGGNVLTNGGGVLTSGGNINLLFGDITQCGDLAADYATIKADLQVVEDTTLKGYAYIGQYGGGYALTVNAASGSVVLKKAQGDISMGIYGN